MGFILFCVGFFIVWSIFSMFELFGKIIELLKLLIDILIKKIKRTSNANESNKILEEIRMFNNTQINKEVDSYPIDSRVCARVDSLVKLYPYCDMSLVEKYKKEFLFLPEQEIRNLEIAIRKSHEESIKNRNFVFGEIQYSDLKPANRLEIVNKFPVTMTFYKLKDIYILTLDHSITREKVAYQSKRHATLLQMCNDIYNKIEMFDSMCLGNKIKLEELYNPNDYEDIIDIR